MFRLIKKLFLVLGLGLGAFALYGSLFSEKKPPSDLAKGYLKTKVVNKVSSELIELMEHLDQAQTEESKVKIFSFLLSSGQFRSLIRPELFESIEEFDEKYLPALRQALLDRLYASMSDEDWLAWQNNDFSADGEKTKARSFVDSVRSVNWELGSYIESAGLILSRLFVSTAKGQVFDAKLAYGFIEQRVGTLFSEKVRGQRAPEDFITRDILDDEYFLRLLERARCTEVGANKVDTDLSLNLRARLVQSVDWRRCPSEDFLNFGDFFDSVLQVGVIDDRKLLAASNVDQKPLYLEDSERKKLADLLTLSAVDASDAEDEVQAKKLLRRSKLVYQGLQSQALLESYLKKLDAQSGESRDVVEVEEGVSGDEEEFVQEAAPVLNYPNGSGSEDVSSSESSEGLSWFVFPLLIALGMLAFFAKAFLGFLRNRPQGGMSGNKEYRAQEFGDEEMPSAADSWDFDGSDEIDGMDDDDF